jgi:hypothetical protein
MATPEARVNRFRSYLPDPAQTATVDLANRTVSGGRRPRFRRAMPAVALAGVLMIVGLMTYRGLHDGAPVRAAQDTTSGATTTAVATSPAWGTVLHIRPDALTLPADAATVAKVAEALRQQVAAFGVADASITVAGDHIDIRLPNVSVAAARTMVPASQIIDGVKAMDYAAPEAFGKDPDLPVEGIPGSLQSYIAANFPNALSTVEVVLQTDAAHGSHVVWSFDSLAGEKVVPVPGLPPSIDFFVDRPMVMSGGMTADVWDTGSCSEPNEWSLLFECDGSGRRTDTEVTFVGRVDRSVTLVEGRYRSGAPVSATVENGWFMFVGDAKRGVPQSLNALDATGKAIGTPIIPNLNQG